MKSYYYVKKMHGNLKESGGVGDVIPHPSLSSDAYLILVYRSLCLGLLYPLIPIHLNQTIRKSKLQKQRKMKSEDAS